MTRLGITAVELLPVHYHIDDRHLQEKGLVNYWGYNTLGFLAPDYRYSGADPVGEFKAMVKALHSAGIEVILDVVYNHTAEGNHLGPTPGDEGDRQRLLLHALARGPPLLHGLHRLRQRAQHVAPAGPPAHHGQPPLLGHGDARRRLPVRPGQHPGPRAPRDRPAGHVLRHHPPGPDDLAGQADRRALGRRPRRLSGRQLPGPLDRVERQVSRHRPRASGRAKGGIVNEFATRFSGSSDLYQDDGRKPYASINFVTCHDGFTLQDLVSYNEKHNEANGEDNRDGADDNRSWNCGVEGPTDDPAINALRERQKRNLMATLLLSQGVPMICAGDELATPRRGATTPTARTTTSPGSTGTWTTTEAKFLDFVGEAGPDPQDPAGLPAAAVLQGAADPRGQGHLLARPVRRGDGRGRLGRRLRQVRRASAWPAT